MIYKPKYCCHCGEKIERTKWTLASSRRFCPLCETDFALQEWIPRLIVGLGLVFVIIGFAGYFQNAEKPLKIVSTRSVEPASVTKKNSVNQSPNEKAAATNANFRAPLQNTANTAEQKPHQIAALTKQATASKASENQSAAVETIYFCGAVTKKGKPCSHRVKGGGRCWQHAGQPAVLPPEKLIASR